MASGATRRDRVCLAGILCRRYRRLLRLVGRAVGCGHDRHARQCGSPDSSSGLESAWIRSEEHTSELQSLAPHDALPISGIGACFAWWAAPLVVGMIGTPDNAVRLILPADWRVLGFGVAMALGCTILFGLAPALRVSGVKPAGALKGGNPHMRPH